jgi:hypothetical protein
MTHYNKSYARWAGIAGALSLPASTFASSPIPNFGSETIAIGAFLGAFVGVIGATFNAKASRLLPISSLVVVLLLSFLMMLFYGGSPIGILAAAILALPFVVGLSFVFGFVRLALHVFARPPQ